MNNDIVSSPMTLFSFSIFELEVEYIGYLMSATRQLLKALEFLDENILMSF